MYMYSTLYYCMTFAIPIFYKLSQLELVNGEFFLYLSCEEYTAGDEYKINRICGMLRYVIKVHV